MEMNDSKKVHVATESFAPIEKILSDNEIEIEIFPNPEFDIWSVAVTLFMIDFKDSKEYF